VTEALQQEIRTLRSLLDSPRDPGGRAFAPLADAYSRSGRIPEALRLVNEGLAKHPDFATGHAVAARIYVEQGLGAEGALAARRALELDAENVLALRSLLRALDESGDAEAGDVRQRLVTLEPDFAPDWVVAPAASGPPSWEAPASPDAATIPVRAIRGGTAAPVIETVEPDLAADAPFMPADAIDLGAIAPSPAAELLASPVGPEALPVAETWDLGLPETVPSNAPLQDLFAPEGPAASSEAAVEAPFTDRDVPSRRAADEPVADFAPFATEPVAEEPLLDLPLLAPEPHGGQGADMALSAPGALAPDEPVTDMAALAPEAFVEEPVMDMAALAPEAFVEEPVLELATLAPEEEAVVSLDALAPDADEPVMDLATLAPDDEQVVSLEALAPDAPPAEEPVVEMGALAPDASDDEPVMDLAALAPDMTAEEPVMDLAALAPDVTVDEPVVELATLAPDVSAEEPVMDLAALAPDEEEVVSLEALAPDAPAGDEPVVDLAALAPDVAVGDIVLEVATLAPESAAVATPALPGPVTVASPERGLDYYNEPVLDLDALAPARASSDEPTPPSARPTTSEEPVDIAFLSPDEPDAIVIDLDALRPEGPGSGGEARPAVEAAVVTAAATPAPTVSASVPEPVVSGDEDDAMPEVQPVRTRTLAELYAKQGAVKQAIDVLKYLQAQSPGDADLARRIAELEAGGPAMEPVASAAAKREAEVEALAKDLAEGGVGRHDVESPFAWTGAQEGAEPSTRVVGPTIREYFDGMLNWEPSEGA